VELKIYHGAHPRGHGQARSREALSISAGGAWLIPFYFDHGHRRFIGAIITIISLCFIQKYRKK
jgi:hypothetical protein